MPRRLKQAFQCRPIAELAQQLLLAPIERRREQALRSERLHDEIDARSNYSLEFIKYKLTGYRDEHSTSTVMTGQALLPDLRLLIDRLTHSAPLPIDGEEPVEIVEDLAARLNVSTKTIARWRQSGLRWRWVSHGEDLPPRVAVPRSAIDAFQQHHADRVSRASQFTQLDVARRKRMIERAMRIVRAREDVSLFRVASHLAQRIGRATETIRLLLEQHDREHPEDPIILDRVGVLTEEQKREIAHARSLGIAVSALARRYRKTHSTIRRAINEHRAAAVRHLASAYLESTTFTRKDADQVILRAESMQALQATEPAAMRSDDIPEPLQPILAIAPLKDEDMRSLITRMHYLRWRAAQSLGELDRYEPRVSDLDRIETDLKQAADLRDRLVARSLPAALSVCRRHLITLPDRSQSVPVLLRLVEMSLPLVIDAVEQYDYRQNRTFTDWLRGMLMRLFATRTVIEEVSDTGGEGKAKAKSRSPLTGHGENVLIHLRELAAQRGVKL
ncbi:MAG: hypothetical protein WD768_20210 [Phycisphaeraceae bacterium]